MGHGRIMKAHAVFTAVPQATSRGPGAESAQVRHRIGADQAEVRTPDRVRGNAGGARPAVGVVRRCRVAGRVQPGELLRASGAARRRPGCRVSCSVVRAPRITELTPPAGRAARPARPSPSGRAARLGDRLDGVDDRPGALAGGPRVVGLHAAAGVLAEPGRAAGALVPGVLPGQPAAAERRPRAAARGRSRRRRGRSPTRSRGPAGCTAAAGSPAAARCRASATSTVFCTCQPVKFDSPA